MALRAPNFLIVGVTKSGTTFLSKGLSSHPDVFFSRPKEPFFFSAGEVTESSFSDYLYDYFAGETGQRWLGEGSTNYFHNEQAIDFIERFLGPQTHIIVCLRHPVGRLISHYLHDYKRARLTGEENLQDAVFEGYFERSLYSERLALWRSRFPNFLVQFFDDLCADPPAFYRQGASFLTSRRGLSKAISSTRASRSRGTMTFSPFWANRVRGNARRASPARTLRLWPGASRPISSGPWL